MKRLSQQLPLLDPGLSQDRRSVAVENFEAIRAALVEHDEPHDVLDPTEVEALAPRTRCTSNACGAPATRGRR
jgi:hypothetical protein